MQINNQVGSLFDYIGNDSKANQVLDDLARGVRKDQSGGLGALEVGLSGNQFEETLERVEKGEIDLSTVENYFLFNQSKLDRELERLGQLFDLGPGVKVTLEEGQLQVADDSKNGQALQSYLNKDTELRSLIEQTGKLSQFSEWGQAKAQAAVYKEEGMPEDELVEFLKEARKVITDINDVVLTAKGAGFASVNRTQDIIDGQQ